MKEIIKTITLIVLFSTLSVDYFTESKMFMGYLMALGSILELFGLISEIKGVINQH